MWTCITSTLSVLATACGGGGGNAPTNPPLPPAPPTPPAAITLREVAANLDQPLLLTAPPGDTRQFIVERPGRVRIVDGGLLLSRPFLDITSLAGTAGEGGLLSIAFHPRYAQNGTFFLYYTDKLNNIAIDRAVVSADPNVADPQSVTRLLTIPHPTYTNHFGGMLAFGPDGYLYAGTGDGGGAGDQQGNAQNTSTLLGKLLRLDVDSTTSLIPAGNPYVGQAGRRGEIWALGLRNPWRFAFDNITGQLYVADVGQDAREEVNVVPATQAAANYGWNAMEGSACYQAGCVPQSYVLPRFEYEHGAGNANGCSITGGFVYRGTALPELAGRYLYSDYCRGFLKSFLYAGGVVSEQKDWGIAGIGNVVSFGQDAQGELYLLAQGGSVYRIVRAP